MLELSAENARDYLNRRPGLPVREWRITTLGGGISNTVLLAECGPERMVLKQSLARLRVEEDWPADRTRIEREWLAMQGLEPHLPTDAVPEVLFTDRDNYLFAMSAAPPEAVTWKDQLLTGIVDIEIAERVALMLGAVFRATWKNPIWERDFGDLTAFEQLRLDPYYVFTASRHPDLTARFEARANEARTRRLCAVHGDYSPKNFLVHEANVVAIDWEVIHYGDPSFDAAFLLNHLLLKALYQPRWAGKYNRAATRFLQVLNEELPSSETWFEPGTCAHLGCLLLARIDGKSPAEYITGEALQTRIRDAARAVILDPPDKVSGLFEQVQS